MILTFGFDADCLPHCVAREDTRRMTLQDLLPLPFSSMGSREGGLLVEMSALTPAVIDLLTPALFTRSTRIGIVARERFCESSLRVLRCLASEARPPIWRHGETLQLRGDDRQLFRRTVSSEVLYLLVSEFELRNSAAAMEALWEFARPPVGCGMGDTHAICTAARGRSARDVQVYRALVRLAQIAVAAEELQRRSRPVTSVSNASGFGSSRSLQRHLKRALSLSPSSLRAFGGSVDATARFLLDTLSPGLRAHLHETTDTVMPVAVG
jgi:AraC-like DNA-binding protein